MEALTRRKPHNIRLFAYVPFINVTNSNLVFLRFWTDREEAASLRVEQVGIQRKISIQRFLSSGIQGPWESSEDARKLKEQSEVFKLEHTLVKKQSQKLQKSPRDPLYQSMKAGMAFVKLYISSPKGLGLKVKGTERDNSVQSNFRRELIQSYNVAHPDSDRGALWCAVTKRWVEVEATTAAHIFAYHNGEDTMDAIYGPEPAGSELFSSLNGLILSTTAEQRFDKGQFVIVPALSDNATADQVEDWQNSTTKDYKIRVVDAEAANMRMFISPESPKRWVDLDNETVEFRGDFRPRARYLYFHFVCSMIRRAWNKEKKERVLVDQLGKKFWGTPGPYMRQAMLKAFVTEVGHDFEDLLEGTEHSKDEDQEQDDTALAAAAEQIYFSNQRESSENLDSDSDSDSDSDDEETLV